MSQRYSEIELEREGNVGTVRLNRPDKLNALSYPLMAEVLAALEELAQDDDIRAVILTGNGRAFSAGYDIEGDLSEDDPEKVGKAVKHSDEFARAIWSFPKPIVAAVHGYCLAGACEIAMLCDATVAAQSSRFGEPEIRFGTGSTLVMPWLVPMKAAKELLLGGSLISADRAYQIGMVNRVVPDDEIIPAAKRFAELWAKVAPPAIRYTKQGINDAYEAAGMWRSVAHHSELVTLMMLAPSEEKDRFFEISARDGLRAALEWRDTQFSELDAEDSGRDG